MAESATASTIRKLASKGRWDDRRKLTAEETYFEVEDLIRYTVWGIIKKYGGNFEDMMCEANVAFLEAYDSYDERVPFAAWVRQHVFYELVENVRRRCTEKARYEYADEQQIVGSYRDWNVEDLLEDLDDDARLVVQMVVETPAELLKIINNKGGQARNYRSSIRDYLSALGWTTTRVAECFNEIRQALSE